MSQELATMMFDILSRRIGSKVSCKIWQYGEEKTIQGILMDVIPFDIVNIDNNVISFVGEGQAIEEIIHIETGKVIYANTKARGYSGARDTMGVVRAQEEMLGYSVKMEDLQNSKKAR